VRFWDTSAVVPLLMSQAATAAVTAEIKRDPEIVVWWATDVECVSAIARLEREIGSATADIAGALSRLDELAASWHEVQPGPAIRPIAARLLRVHPLRAADSLQLAAAILAGENESRSLPFVTLDDRLAQAASREGFPVVRPAPA
jgi:uncharacterized protein